PGAGGAAQGRGRLCQRRPGPAQAPGQCPGAGASGAIAPMTYFFIGGALLLAALAAWQYLKKLGRQRVMRGLRWVVGGAAALLAPGLILVRRYDIALFVGAAAVSSLRRGRLGPYSFETGPELGGSN